MYVRYSFIFWKLPKFSISTSLVLRSWECSWQIPRRENHSRGMWQALVLNSSRDKSAINSTKAAFTHSEGSAIHTRWEKILVSLSLPFRWDRKGNKFLSRITLKDLVLSFHLHSPLSYVESLSGALTLTGYSRSAENSNQIIFRNATFTLFRKNNCLLSKKRSQKLGTFRCSCVNDRWPEIKPANPWKINGICICIPNSGITDQKMLYAETRTATYPAVSTEHTTPISSLSRSCYNWKATRLLTVAMSRAHCDLILYDHDSFFFIVDVISRIIFVSSVVKPRSIH